MCTDEESEDAELDVKAVVKFSELEKVIDCGSAGGLFPLAAGHPRMQDDILDSRSGRTVVCASWHLPWGLLNLSFERGGLEQKNFHRLLLHFFRQECVDPQLHHV